LHLIAYNLVSGSQRKVAVTNNERLIMFTSFAV